MRFAALLGVLVFAGAASALGVAGAGSWTSGGGNISGTSSSDSNVLSAQNVSRLSPEWSFPYPGYQGSPGAYCGAQENPVVVGDTPGTPGAVYVPDNCGYLDALNPDTGAQLWRDNIQDLTGVYGDLSDDSPAVEADPSYTGDTNMVFFGDTGTYPNSGQNPAQAQSIQQHLDSGIPLSADLVAVNAATGALDWKTSLSSHPWARLKGSPLVYDGVVYEGVSSQEEAASGLKYSSAQTVGPPSLVGTPYPCCSFRGSVVAVDAVTGKILWQTYTVPGGDNGGAVWEGTPAFDPATDTLFVTTGNNYTAPDPATTTENHQDSIIALNASNGQIKWAAGLQPIDVYNHSLPQCPGGVCQTNDPFGYGSFTYSPAGYGPNGCGLKPAPTCNTSKGWDYDLTAPNLFTAQVTSAGCGINHQSTPIVGVGSKSGMYTALDAATGCILWSTDIGPGSKGGGVQWVTATDGQRVYAEERDFGHVPYQIKEPDGSLASITTSSLIALDAATGTILWQTPDPSGDTNLFSLPTVANGVLYVPGVNAFEMYAFDVSTGNKLWQFTNRFRGGFLAYVEAGPAIVNGVVYWPGAGTMWAFALPGWQQLTALLAAVTGVGPGTSLADKITTTETDVEQNDNADACGTLGAFINQVNAQTGTKITTAQAASLITQAHAAENAIVCPTVIGQTSSSGPYHVCQTEIDGNSSVASGNAFVVPAGTWSVTSWSTYAGTPGGTMSLMVLRPQGGGNYQVVGESPSEALTANELNTFTLSSPIAVQPGDQLGFWADGSACLKFTGNAGDQDTFDYSPSEPASGTTIPTEAYSGFVPNISATLTPGNHA
jgi:polyvinyl alcohol dehydrogenase (cytochrome)